MRKVGKVGNIPLERWLTAQGSLAREMFGESCPEPIVGSLLTYCFVLDNDPTGFGIVTAFDSHLGLMSIFWADQGVVAHVPNYPITSVKVDQL